MTPKDLLLQTSTGRSPAPLELFVRLQGADESHFYTQGLSMTDFGSLFGLELKPLDVLATRLPSELLNPNYWEPLTKEAETAVREKLGGIITRTEGDRALLFRADRVSRGRLLRDGLDVPVELLNGSIFRIYRRRAAQARPGLERPRPLRVGRPRGPPQGRPPRRDALARSITTWRSSRLSLREEVFLFSSQDDGLVRTVFAKRAHFTARSKR